MLRPPSHRGAGPRGDSSLIPNLCAALGVSRADYPSCKSPPQPLVFWWFLSLTRVTSSAPFLVAWDRAGGGWAAWPRLRSAAASRLSEPPAGSVEPAVLWL